MVGTVDDGEQDRDQRLQRRCRRGIKRRWESGDKDGRGGGHELVLERRGRVRREEEGAEGVEERSEGGEGGEEEEGGVFEEDEEEGFDGKGEVAAEESGKGEVEEGEREPSEAAGGDAGGEVVGEELEILGRDEGRRRRRLGRGLLLHDPWGRRDFEV